MRNTSKNSASFHKALRQRGEEGRGRKRGKNSPVCLQLQLKILNVTIPLWFVKPTQNPTLPYPTPPQTPWFLHTQTSARNFKSQPHITSTTCHRQRNRIMTLYVTHCLPYHDRNVRKHYNMIHNTYSNPPATSSHPTPWCILTTWYIEAKIVTRAELDGYVHVYILCHIPWASDLAGMSRSEEEGGLPAFKAHTRRSQPSAIPQKSFKARPRSHPNTATTTNYRH